MNNTPQGDIFFWKYLRWDPEHWPEGILISPYRKTNWVHGKCEGNVNTKRGGIYGYWTLQECLAREFQIHANFPKSGFQLSKIAIVRCRIFGRVGFGLYGARAQHAEIVDMGVTADIFTDVTNKYPGIPVRHLHIPLSYTWPEYQKETVAAVLKGLNLVPPPLTVADSLAPKQTSIKIEYHGQIRYLIFFSGIKEYHTIAWLRREWIGTFTIPATAIAVARKSRAGPGSLSDAYQLQTGDHIEFLEA